LRVTMAKTGQSRDLNDVALQGDKRRAERLRGMLATRLRRYVKMKVWVGDGERGTEQPTKLQKIDIRSD